VLHEGVDDAAAGVRIRGVVVDRQKQWKRFVHADGRERVNAGA
jgi:hypothetical protein